MPDFQDPPIQLPVSDVVVGNQNLNVGALAAFPRALQISVTDAQQVFPNQGPTVNTVFVFAGIARFGQDTVPHQSGQEHGPLSGEEGVYEDPDNRFDEGFEVDEGTPKTLYLGCLGNQLQQQFQSAASAGSSSFTALAEVGLDTTDVFGADTNNGFTELTSTSPSGLALPEDFWLFSDVFAEKHCILSRLGYQATVLLQTQTLATPASQEVPIPHVGSVVDLDVANPNQVVSPGALDVGISDGLQVFPAAGGTNGANRLLILTGTALCNVTAPQDNLVFAAVVRIRLQFPTPSTLILKGSATTVALASIHSNDEEPALFGVNAARIVTDPTDGGTLPQASPPLPSNEFYLLAELRAAGAENGARPGVSRIAFQANILVEDTLPDLDSILVSPAGAGTFGPEVTVSLSGNDALYDIQLNLTGPPPPNSTFKINIQSSEPQNVLVPPLVVLTQQTTVISNNLVVANTPNGAATLTATGRRVVRTATVVISQVK